MTRYDEETTTTSQHSATACDCEGCRTGDLPVNPFVALRVAYGMLLGEEDFRALMGNARGKQMLHAAWLHGSGVVWGYDVRVRGSWDLEITGGLAVDGVGRELLNEATTCVDVRDLVKATQSKDEGCATRTVTACLVAEFDSCLSAAVPTLADPCDVTRKHDDYSRVVERVRLSLREGCCPRARRPYHRVRVLLGLDPVGPKDAPGEEALEARLAVAAACTEMQAMDLLKQFRRLATLDSVDLHPARDDGDCYPTLFPVAEEDAAVVLAQVEIDIVDQDGCMTIRDVRLWREARRVLLPTATIQELACGLAPGLLGGEVSVDAGGPRVIGDRIVLSGDGRRLTIPVTKPLARGSVRGCVGITSLSLDRAGGWVVEDIDDTTYDESTGYDDNTGHDDSTPAVVIDLADRPIGSLIRVVVRGTGPRPLMGEAGVPLAGLVGGPPATRHDGHDAVWTFENRVKGRGQPGSPPTSAAVADAEIAAGEDEETAE